MTGFLSAGRLMGVALIGLGLATGAWADPPPPPPPTLPDPGADAIKPLPLVPIPDDPPPHEGAMIQIPYVIEPPDLVLIEVLEALPGRPISGERLVRPDGTITLGFYGDINVAGLTTDQIKEKVIAHLQKWITDEALGLFEMDAATEKITPVKPKDSTTVFVDVIAYNSKFYYMDGEVASPGRYNITGKDTVRDAIHLAEGLTPLAATDKIRLIRKSESGRATQ